MNTRLMVVFVCALALHAQSANAQIFLRKAVVGSGGGVAANSTTVLQCTVGQTAAGRASNAGMFGQFGFWNSATTAAAVPKDRAGDILSLRVSPNPAGKTLIATAELVATTKLTVSLYDVKGTRIATLADGIYSPGHVEVSYDLSTCPSGVYFLSAQVPGALVQRQVTVVR